MKSEIFYIYMFILHFIIPQNGATSGNLHQDMKEKDRLWKSFEIIIKNCYTKYFGNLIMIGNWTSVESNVLKVVFLNSIPVNLVAVNDHTIFHNHQRFRGLCKINETVIATKCKPATNVTIVVLSNVTLVNILTNLKGSIWWNNQAYFLLINTDSHNGCRSARQFLKIIWDFKVLSALYFCRNKEGRVIIYNFNPYARLGSEFWKVVDDFNEESERWTLLQFHDNKSQFHDSSIRKCNVFNIDKTKNLYQYKVRLGGIKSLQVAIPKNPRLGFADYGNIDYKVFDVVLERLNARATLKYYKRFGFISKNGPTGFLKDIQLGTIDFLTIEMLMRDYWKLMTYPATTNGVCIVAKVHHLSIAQKFLSIFINEVWYCLIGTSILSIITLKYIFSLSFIASFLEFLRMFIANSTLRSPTSLRSKFLLLNILFLIFLINAYIQSQLSSVMTGPDSIRLIDSSHDLIPLNLPIYSEPHHRDLAYPLQLRERIQVIPDIRVCLKRLGNGDDLICLVHYDLLKAFQYLNNEIYRAKNNLVNRPIAYTFVEDWPLTSKVNSLLTDINEVGIFTFYMNYNLKRDEETTDNVIDLKEMKFCFLFFYWSCILSIIMFLIELIIVRLKSCVNFFAKNHWLALPYQKKVMKRK